MELHIFISTISTIYFYPPHLWYWILCVIEYKRDWLMNQPGSIPPLLNFEYSLIPDVITSLLKKNIIFCEQFRNNKPLNFFRTLIFNGRVAINFCQDNRKILTVPWYYYHKSSVYAIFPPLILAEISYFFRGPVDDWGRGINNTSGREATMPMEGMIVKYSDRKEGQVEI